jgi:RimJ/RimL family protein N-acetyltransferase
MLTATEPTIRAFQETDAEAIVNRDGLECSPATICAQAAQGVALTAELDGVPIGCAGVMIPWPGVGHAWMLLSHSIEGHERWMYRVVKAFLEDIVTTQHLHRVESVALADSPRNQRWQEALGMTREQDGIARQLLQDRRSMIRYEWVRGD